MIDACCNSIMDAMCQEKQIMINITMAYIDSLDDEQICNWISDDPEVVIEILGFNPYADGESAQ